jgi:hypothetical protein
MRTFTSFSRAFDAMRLTTITSVLLALTLGGAGCASSKGFKMKDAPSGFAEVEAWTNHARFKAGDDVGLRVDALPNVKGGTLEYWAEDLVEKLAERGYTLKSQSAVRSKNGRDGTRFDFTYRSPTTGEDKFFTTILFTTDEWRVVVQLAGDASLASKLDARIQDSLGLTRVFGCKLGKPVCKAPQPPSLVGKYTAAVLPTIGGEAEPSPEGGKPEDGA